MIIKGNSIWLSLFFLIFNSYSEPLKILMMLKGPLKVNQQYVVNQINGLRKHNFLVWLYIQSSGNKNSVDINNEVILDDEDLASHNFIPPEFQKADVIICQYGSLALEVVSKKENGLIDGKVVVFYRGGDVNELGKYSKTTREIIFKKIDYFAPVCDALKKDLIKLGCPTQKIKVISSAIDCSKFTRKNLISNHTSIHIISIGRLVEKKGLCYAIKAMAPLFKRFSGLKYTIVGDGSDKAKLLKLIKDYNLQDKIQLIGWKNQNTVIKLLEQSDIFVLPSVQSSIGTKEGIPNVLKEAMMMELPVVSTYHSGIPEIVKNGVNGLLVKEKDVVALSKCLNFLIKNPVVRINFGKAGRKAILKDYNSEIESEKLAVFLRDFCK